METLDEMLKLYPRSRTADLASPSSLLWISFVFPHFCLSRASEASTARPGLVTVPLPCPVNLRPPLRENRRPLYLAGH